MHRFSAAMMDKQGTAGSTLQTTHRETLTVNKQQNSGKFVKVEMIYAPRLGPLVDQDSVVGRTARCGLDGPGM